MARVLITSIGASPAIDVARSLREDPTLHLIGADADRWGRALGERLCHEVRSLPRADRDPEGYVDALFEACSGVDFLFVGLDAEIEVLAGSGRTLPVASALAPAHVLHTVVDKARTIRAAGRPELFPRTLELGQGSALANPFPTLEAPAWLRPSGGTSGKGSLLVRSNEETHAWVQYWERRVSGLTWMAQEFLPGRNVNWSGIFANGELVAEAAMERLIYLLGEVSPSGVTGQVKLCEVADPADMRDVSLAVVHAVDPSPHGVYSVDLRQDVQGAFKVTEINPRLAGRPWLYTQAGANLPLAACRALRGLEVGDAVQTGGARIGLQEYRQVDVEPLFGMRPTDGSGH